LQNQEAFLIQKETYDRFLFSAAKEMFKSIGKKCAHFFNMDYYYSKSPTNNSNLYPLTVQPERI